MHLTRRGADDPAAKAKPVGLAPYPAAPRCGLYYVGEPSASTTDDSQLAPTIAALRTRIVKTSSSPSSSAEAVDHFDLLSVSDVTPVSCVECHWRAQLSSKTIAYTIQTTYDLSTLTPTKPMPQLVWLFPFSECGSGAESFQVTAGSQPLLGELVRVRRRDGRLVSSAHRQCFLAETSDMTDDEEGVVAEGGELNRHQSSSKGSKLLYLFVAERSMLQFVAEELWRTGQTTLQIDVQWRNKITPPLDEARTEPLYVPFSYYCSPRSPDRISCVARFDQGTRLLLVRSPNCRGTLSLRAHLDGNRADVQVESLDADGRRSAGGLASWQHPNDYLWVFEFRFGSPPKAQEEVSTWGLTCIVLVAALVAWYLLTKDLEL